ncbi:xanthine dehydrogenase isoform X1 [Nasonia vitripennis]|uniref:xanthine dehydrogenase n=3 Tax=Nasonia vitripennis TaxID=7425 RepID=A0A7M7QEJ7_NASVI|nr:xanthine dehydrogenase isoform X1 [Nasonia vitripennis]XP_032455768.1 xanthine dehydrogenase isoform X1 [Nasonia vitripennis]
MESKQLYDVKENEDNHQIEKISNFLIFYVNGKMIKDCNIEPEWTLIYYLRNKLGLCGTKLGCSEGNCGACTVMISRFDRKNNKIIHLAANACLTPVCAMHGMAVTTVEGIGSTRNKLHPVQERLAKAHGSQCGFCTPGIVMSMYALLRSNPKPTMNDIDIAFQGNLCRCTGYRPIIEGLRTFTKEWEQSRMSKLKNHEEKLCALGNACCKKAFTSEPTALFDSKEFTPYDSSQEPIFPPSLQLSSNLDDEYLIISGKEVTWYRPTQLKKLLILKNQYPNAKIIVGNTEVGVEVKIKHLMYPVLIQSTAIKELKIIEEMNDGIKIGASVTLVEMESALRHQISTKHESRTRIFGSIVKMLHWFAGHQIRNVAAVGGNIMTGSPISDLNPIFLAVGIKLNLCSLNNGHRSVIMDNTFFLGYRRNIVAPDEVLLSIEVPFNTPNQYFVSYKQSKRRDDDITIVNMAMNVFFKPNTNIVQKINLTFGGMAPITVLAKKTCESLVGKNWDESILEAVTNNLVAELTLPGNAPGGMILYRRSLTLSLFFKGFISIWKKLHKDIPNIAPVLKELESASDGFHYLPPKSSQYYQMVSKDQSSIDLIGRPLIHASAFKQASGEAIYCDDIPRITGELYLALVLSTRAHARITGIDNSKAVALDGVVAYFDAKDIPEHRRFVGPIIKDEEVFVSEKVTCHGQVIAAIVAVDQVTAQKAARMVKIDYEELQPVLLTIEDAIEAKSFLEKDGRSITKGNVDEAFTNVDHILEGEIRMGGQEHFYLETQCSIAIPKEEHEMEIIASTQDLAEMQRLIAHVLDIPINRVTVRTKRLGGGFGGKESRSMLAALPVAFAAHSLQKPVRCMLDRDEDMMITGTRHPFLFKYKVGFSNEGLIKVLEVYVYANVGCSWDLSGPAISRTMAHIENAYRIPAIRVIGYLCKTNLPSNTAFRGFGGPQGMFCAETIIRHIADYLDRDVVQLSEINLYKEGDITHYNQKLENCTMQRCWIECLAFSNYEQRLAAVQKFNSENRYKKKGITVIPTKFGIAFETLFLNQGGALVHIYTDGSVLLTHGGIEMGQGVHTKMIQVASRILKVHPDKILITETATDKVPNATATAASTGSDLNGMAIMDACNKIMKRIKYIIDANPEGTWESWIEKAYFDRVSLSATGFYRTPDIGYDFATNSGTLYDYFTYGVACSEVIIDSLTGDHQVLRTDIVMDLGESLNPAIDIGQVEGGFIQGYGLFTMEEMIYSPTGIVYSRGPGVYKIPGFADIPQEFNVSLLKGSSNPRAVYSSKAIGEPPLFLSSSIFFAIKNAIKAARKDMNLHGYFRFDSPATAARIRMACTDDFTKKIGDGDGKKPWNITP